MGNNNSNHISGTLSDAFKNALSQSVQNCLASTSSVLIDCLFDSYCQLLSEAIQSAVESIPSVLDNLITSLNSSSYVETLFSSLPEFWGDLEDYVVIDKPSSDLPNSPCKKAKVSTKVFLLFLLRDLLPFVISVADLTINCLNTSAENDRDVLIQERQKSEVDIERYKADQERYRAEQERYKAEQERYKADSGKLALYEEHLSLERNLLGSYLSSIDLSNSSEAEAIQSILSALQSVWNSAPIPD